MARYVSAVAHPHVPDVDAYQWPPRRSLHEALRDADTSMRDPKARHVRTVRIDRGGRQTLERSWSRVAGEWMLVNR